MIIAQCQVTLAGLSGGLQCIGGRHDSGGPGSHGDLRRSSRLGEALISTSELNATEQVRRHAGAPDAWPPAANHERASLTPARQRDVAGAQHNVFFSGFTHKNSCYKWVLSVFPSCP